MKCLRRLAALVALVVVAAIAPARTASAACHSFTVTASPDRAGEGASVTVTVKRDAANNPSQIDVSTVDETARAGQDYTELRQTVSFTTDTQKTFSIPVTDDAASEADETFRVHLSNPGGCAVNPNFAVGPDAKVTIDDNDPEPSTETTAAPATTVATVAPGAPSAAAGPSTTSKVGTTSSTGAASTTSVSESSTGITTTTVREQAAGADADGGGLSGGAAAAALAAFVAASAGMAGYALHRRRGAAAG